MAKFECGDRVEMALTVDRERYHNDKGVPVWAKEMDKILIKRRMVCQL